jgi:hypothetical protein
MPSAPPGARPSKWSRQAAARPARSPSFPRIARHPNWAAPWCKCAWTGCVLSARASGGACWLALELWGWLQLDVFWAPRLPASRKGTAWLNVLKTLVVYRLIDPGQIGLKVR